MQPLNIPDHDTYWADNERMKQLTKAYYERAQAVIASRIFLDQIRHPWMEDGFEIDTEVQIFELVGDHCGLEEVTVQTDNPRDLLMYWESTAKDGTESKTNRRIILLQDMHPRIIELLGVLLDIPPHFFLAHCDEFVNLSVVDHACAKQGSSVYWRVPVPQRRNGPGVVDRGVYYVEAGNFGRREVNLFEPIGHVSYHSLVSYWGKSYGADSWTAVILIDPFETYLRLKTENMGRSSPRIPLSDFRPLRDFHHEVILDCTDDDRKQAYHRCIFHTAVATHKSQGLYITEDPFTGTAFVRNLIRSAWEELVLRESMVLNDILVGDAREHQNRRGNMATQNPMRTKGVSPDVVAIHAYEKLMDQRRFIATDREALKSIMWNFGFKYDEDGPQFMKEEIKA